MKYCKVVVDEVRFATTVKCQCSAVMERLSRSASEQRRWEGEIAPSLVVVVPGCQASQSHLSSGCPEPRCCSFSLPASRKPPGQGNSHAAPLRASPSRSETATAGRRCNREGEY